MPDRRGPVPSATARPRTWLDVPFAEKDQAKAAGARWDATAKRWHDPRPEAAGNPRRELARWTARAEVPDLLPGEDPTFGSGLFVDMVPESCWFTNIRTCVSQQDWERLRRMITRRAGHKCEICGAIENRTVERRLEAHERWAYDERSGVQALRRLICLCSPCHLSTHMGYANVTDRADQALAHLCDVTGMSQSEAWRHVEAAGALWTTRSRRNWTLDLSMLTDAGITLAQPEDPAARADRAQEQLAVVRTPQPPPQPAARPTPQLPSAPVTAAKPAAAPPSVSRTPSRSELLAEARRAGPLTAAVKKFLRRSDRT